MFFFFTITTTTTINQSKKKQSKYKSNISNSLGGPQPYVPVGLDNEQNNSTAGNANCENPIKSTNNQRRARVLCSYDAKDATELNLTGNEVVLDFIYYFFFSYIII